VRDEVKNTVQNFDYWSMIQKRGPKCNDSPAAHGQPGESAHAGGRSLEAMEDEVEPAEPSSGGTPPAVQGRIVTFRPENLTQYSRGVTVGTAFTRPPKPMYRIVYICDGVTFVESTLPRKIRTPASSARFAM
jgi:hypothetical protein